ncbi:hypothetical protein GCM10009795_004690 [Nocardioides hankookensis]
MNAVTDALHVSFAGAIARLVADIDRDIAAVALITSFCEVRQEAQRVGAFSRSNDGSQAERTLGGDQRNRIGICHLSAATTRHSRVQDYAASSGFGSICSGFDSSAAGG